MNDPRAICGECGHVWSWHDRDGAHQAARTETGIDRPCDREVGGAPCRCKGFRDSGEVAVATTGVPRPTRVFRNGVLTLLLVVLGLALLYAYRSQAPAIQTVTITQAIQEVNSGQVKKVTIFAGANRAVLELANADKQQTNLPERDEVFQKALFDYNAANPSRQITIDYQQESPHVLGDRLDILKNSAGVADRRFLLLHDAAVATALRRVALGSEARAERVFSQ